MGEVRLACYTSPWGPDGLIQAITDIGECGFQGIECPASVVQRYEDRLHVFEEILETSDLSLGGLLQGVNLLDREHADEQVERAVNSARFVSAASKGHLTVCHHGPVVAKMTDEDWATVGAMVEEIGARCAEFGIRMCFLPRAQNLVSTDREIKRLMASTSKKHVMLALDTAEVVLAGGSPQRMVKSMADRLCTVRYREASASKRRAKSTSNRPGSTPQFGRGAVKFEQVSKALLASGYSGWVTLDISGESQSPLDAASSGFRYLMRKSGLYAL